MRHARLPALLIAVLALTGASALAHGRLVMQLGFMYKPHEFPVSGDGDFIVPVRVTLSHRTYCANLHRTVYNNKIVARILGPNVGVFGSRTLGRVYTCAGTWPMTAADSAGAAS